MPHHAPAALFAHHGVFSTQDAARLGVDDRAISAMVRSRELVRVRRGAYVNGSLWAAARPEARLALRTRAVLRARGDGVASHQSALALVDLPLLGMPLDVVDAAAEVTRARRENGLRLHPRPPVTWVDRDGCRAVTTALALAQVAAREGRDGFVAAADRAFHRGLATPDDVLAALETLDPTPRVRVRVAFRLSLTDGRCESVGETRTRLLLRDLGFEPRSQVRIASGDEVVARVDFLVGERVIVEFDGLVKYEGAAGREALAAEKRREDLLRSLGFEVVRLTWRDLDDPARVARLVRAAIARSHT